MDETQNVDFNFFDIDDIIAKSESTSCTFDGDAFGEDFYEEILGIGRPKINAGGFSVDAPYWLIDSVKTKCRINVSQTYGPTMQSVLTADAKNINLARQEQNFFAIGMELCQLLKEEDPDGAYKLSKCLLSTLTQRLGGIIAIALHGQNKAEKLANLEIKVFEKGKKHKQDIDNWLRENSKLKTNKRKLQ
ncbi:unnamed protein product [Caenorhabditis angaria]|uniref:DNA replication complex GINS protein PSF3 n=1 Tax=Caenorhabditis angaria TaxID=860376 RepID=A0A9P1I6R1_9PELO|nr:unnamed protein product [Caenorhabditis angaria]